MEMKQREQVLAAIEQVNGILLGKAQAVQELMLAILANGHVLLEDIPGVGKTTLAKAFAQVLGLEYRRVQFTPDVMPSDLTGFSVYRREEERFVYQSGSVFCNLLLADELNRASPKTQSALLEVMEERQVSVEGVTRPVPSPFFVIATQNPFGSAGTQRLPEAQIDRFLISMTLGYPDFDSELAMAQAVGTGTHGAPLTASLDRESLLAVQKEIRQVFLKDTIYRYILELVTATRDHPLLERGASPRATIALVRLSQAAAWLEGRAFVAPEDVSAQVPYALSHRIHPSPAARMDHLTAEQILQETGKSVQKPAMGRP